MSNIVIGGTARHGSIFMEELAKDLPKLHKTFEEGVQEVIDTQSTLEGLIEQLEVLADQNLNIISTSRDAVVSSLETSKVIEEVLNASHIKTLPNEAILFMYGTAITRTLKLREKVYQILGVEYPDR